MAKAEAAGVSKPDGSQGSARLLHRSSVPTSIKSLMALHTNREARIDCKIVLALRI